MFGENLCTKRVSLHFEMHDLKSNAMNMLSQPTDTHRYVERAASLFRKKSTRAAMPRLLDQLKIRGVDIMLGSFVRPTQRSTSQRAELSSVVHTSNSETAFQTCVEEVDPATMDREHH